MNRRYDKPPPLAVSSKENKKKKHFVNHTAPNTPGNHERTQASPTLSTARSHEPFIDSSDGKLSYEIFSILESKFLFGYEDLGYLGFLVVRYDPVPILPTQDLLRDPR